MSFRSALALAALCTVLCAAGPASASTYTVAVSGSDGGDGITAPFRTLQKAVQVARSGDTIIIRAGIYTAGAWIQQANLTIRGEGIVTLDGAASSRTDGLTVYGTSGFTLENVRIRRCRRSGLFCVLSRGLTVRNCEFSGNAGSGILTGNTSDVRVESCAALQNVGHGIYLSQSGDRLRVSGCRLIGNHRAGLQINAVEDGPDAGNASRDGLSQDCVVERNEIAANGTLGGAAINLMGVQRSLVVNNLIHSNLAGGIALWNDGAGASFGCKNNRLYHNTLVFAEGRGRYGVQFLAGSTGNDLLNNIIVCGYGSAIEAEERIESNFNCLSAPTIANGGNLSAWRNSTGNDQNSAQGDPGLTSAYRLGPNSPARDSASALTGTDREGRLRPQGSGPDIGCYEEPSDSPPSAPRTPTGLIATPGVGSAALRWNAVTSTNLAGYRLYRAASQAGSYARVGALLASTSYTQSGLTPGATYWYRVTAAGQDGVESVPSAPVSVVAGTPEDSDTAIYRDALAAGWSASRYRSAYSLSASSPVAEGSRSVALTVTGSDGYVKLSGRPIAVNGKTALRFALHGGGAGGQRLRVRLAVNGVQKRSLNLQNYGVPRAGGWTQYSIPLADLQASAGSITAVKVGAGSPQKKAFLDHIRLE